MVPDLIIRIADAGDPRLADYRHVPDPELLRRGEIFVAEGRLVVRTLLADSTFVTRSVLVTQTAFEALRHVIEPRLPQLPVYLVEQGLIQQLTGFNIHRGCLAIGERPSVPTLEEWLGQAHQPEAVAANNPPLVVLEQIVDADNVGSIFRNAAAFGAAPVVLGPNCCDPLYRKAIRTSMGSALRVPFVHAGRWPDALAVLRAAGFAVVALTPRPDAMPLEEFLAEREAGLKFLAATERPRRIALLAGSEGPGLTSEALAAADVRVRIPMTSGMDSLNVATAVGIALYRLTHIGFRSQESGFSEEP